MIIPVPLRDDQPRYSTPYVNAFLIALNVLIFLFELSLGRSDLKVLFDHFALVPQNITALLTGTWHHSIQQAVFPLFSAMFLHEGWAHVLSNMLFLYIFGDNVEDYLGHFNYLSFYLISGVLADAAQIAVYPHSHIGMVGASGAIAGVLGAYFVVFPRARVLTWFFFVFFFYVPAWLILGYWFVLQFLEGADALAVARLHRDIGGVAVWAHVGGFIAGIVMIKLFPERRRRYPYAYR
ncbi:Rhomboid-like protein [Candidatus Sulfotelmatobacter kueseliae]|uniref:Rhomboid-like protein n=1 Tax=Candidatus Sulfotelmatobacter kueseliae TaxID=2042962 RepID=A0A2U3KP33_9BACT|nr:Rhomboid-like protein [Candidatus Sulfotelmatobacter kueseliae]